MVTSTRTTLRVSLVPIALRPGRTSRVESHDRPEGLSGVFPGAKAAGAEAFASRESARSFAFTALWMAGFLGGGYLLLWKPVLDRWLS